MNMPNSYKIKLAGGKDTGFYANKSGRVQHFPTIDAAKAKRKKEGLQRARIVETMARGMAKKSKSKPKTKPKTHRKSKVTKAVEAITKPIEAEKSAIFENF